MALRVRLGAARIRAPHTDHLGAATAPNIALLGRGGPELMSSESIRLFALTSFSCKPHVECEWNADPYFAIDSALVSGATEARDGHVRLANVAETAGARHSSTSACAG